MKRKGEGVTGVIIAIGIVFLLSMWITVKLIKSTEVPMIVDNGYLVHKGNYYTVEYYGPVTEPPKKVEE